MRPRVALDLTPLATGSRYRGIGTYALDLAMAMAAAPPEDLEVVFVVGYGGRYALLPAHALDRATAYRLCGDHKTEAYQRYYMEKRTALRWFLGRERPALYHATDPVGTPAVPGVHTVVTAHDLIPTLMGPPYRWYPYAVGAAIDRARYDHERVIAISSWTADDIARVARVPRERIDVVRHGVDHGRFTPGRPVKPRERPYVFYVGGFDRRKQVPQLIEAFGRIARDVPDDLVIAGKPAPRVRAALDRLIAALGLEDRVQLLGFVSDAELVDLYRGATAHALPTLYEGFGMTALEAMACGCPVVTLSATCVPEICGDAALMAPPGDVAAFADALGEVCTRPARRQELVERGLARAATFTWAQAARETLDVYRRMLGLA